jgi:predicted outer membrane repeat protein
LNAGGAGYFILGFGSGSSLTINSLVLKGGSSSNDGGAIWIGTGVKVNIYSSTFQSNSADSGSGGAIHIEAGSLEVHGTIFQSNSAYNGGAIHAYGAGLEVKIYTSTFDSNYAEGYAGALNMGGGSFIIEDTKLMPIQLTKVELFLLRMVHR